jgi:hypothetical protein
VPRTKRQSSDPDRSELRVPRAEARRILIGRIDSAKAMLPGRNWTGVFQEWREGSWKWDSTTRIALQSVFTGTELLNRYSGVHIGFVGGPTSDEEEFRDSVDSLRAHVRQLEAIVDGLEFMAEPDVNAERGQREAPAMRDVTVHVHGGSVNFGNIQGDVNANVANLKGPNAEEIKLLMDQLAQVVGTSTGIEDESRDVAAEALEVISEAVSIGPKGRAGALLKSALSRLPAALAAVEEGKRLWEQALPLIQPYLPPDLFR